MKFMFLRFTVAALIAWFGTVFSPIQDVHSSGNSLPDNAVEVIGEPDAEHVQV